MLIPLRKAWSQDGFSAAESDELLDAVLIGGREKRLIVIVDYDFA